MVPRNMAMAGMLGAAVGVPYAVSNAPDGWDVGFSAPAPQQTAAEPVAGPPPARRVLNVPLANLINWSITKEWVYAHWERKTTGLADPRLFGIRTTVVTGARMTDVAGAISYYFDTAGVLQKIRLHGRTADTRELARIAAAHGMRQYRPYAPGEQLFQAYEEKRGVRAQLTTKPEGVLHRATPQKSFVINLELNRPGSDFWVTPNPPQFEMPVADTPPPPAAETEDAIAAQQEPPSQQPILPARSVVPDADPALAAAKAEAEAAEATEAATNASPSTADLRPVYRDRLRWPN